MSKPIEVPKMFYTMKEAAAILGVCPRTIERYVKAGKLPAAKLGKSWKISQEDIQAMFDKAKAESARKLKEAAKKSAE